MTDQEIRNWLDPEIKKLLAEVEAIVPVKFTLWDEDYFACQVHKDTNGVQCEAEVFFKEPPSQPKIAHELLHAKTSLILGDNGIMFSVQNQCALFPHFLSHHNASNIVNACEHNIFFPDYLDMGYAEDDSFEQPQDLEKRMKDISALETHGLKEDGHYSSEKVFMYLGLVFSFLFYPGEKRFKKVVKRLRKIEVSLFTIMMNLKKDCSDLVIVPENKDFLQQSYFEFGEKMNAWMTKAFKGAVFVSQQK